MPQLLSLLILIARSDKTFASWRRIFQAEARSPSVSGPRDFVSEPGGEGLVGKMSIVCLLRFC